MSHYKSNNEMLSSNSSLSRFLIDHSLDDEIKCFKQFIEDADAPIVDLYEVPSRYVHRSHDRKKYSYVPDSHKTYMRTMVNFISQLHKEGLSLDRDTILKEDNLVFQRGQLKFRGLNAMPCSGSKDKQRDYKLLHNLLDHLICEYKPNNYQTPTPIKTFLGDLIDSFIDEAFLANHWALQDSTTMLGILANLHCGKGFLPYYMKNAYNDAVGNMKIRKKYTTNWTLHFDGSEYSDNRVGGLRDTYNFERKAGKTKYVGVGNPRVVNGSILNFCRNNAVHLHEIMGKHKRDFTKEDVFLTIMAFFGEELLSFQKHLYINGIAEYFVPGYKPSGGGETKKRMREMEREYCRDHEEVKERESSKTKKKYKHEEEFRSKR